MKYMCPRCTLGLSVVLLCSISLFRAQVLSHDTLIIGSVRAYPGQQVVVPVFITTSLNYEGWQIPVQFYGADTSWFRIDSVSIEKPDSSCMTFIPERWDFIADFIDNDEWDDMISGGVSGVVDFTTGLTLRPGNYVVMNFFTTIDHNAPFNTTITIDTTTCAWYGNGPENSYAVTVDGGSYQTIVRSGSITINDLIIEDTLFIGDVAAYPGQADVRVPVYSKVTLKPYAGWTLPFRLRGVDTTVVRIDSFSTVNSIHHCHPVVETWDFVSTFMNNYEWPSPPIMSCGVAGVVSFMTADSVPIGYHLAGEICLSVKSGVTPQTIVIDTATTSWYEGGPLQYYNVSTNSGRTYHTCVDAGSIEIKRVLYEDTLFIGSNSRLSAYPGQVCTLSIEMKSTKYAYHGWQIHTAFNPFSADTQKLRLGLNLDSTAAQNSVMLWDPYSWQFQLFFDNNYEWDNMIYGGADGLVWMGSGTPDSLLPGTHRVYDLHIKIRDNAPPQTIILDTCRARTTAGGPLNHNMVTVKQPGSGAQSWKFVTRPCTLSIGGHLWNDTLIIGTANGYPGDTVRVPVYMKNAVTGVGSWNIPLTFGNGDAPVNCDSVNYKAKDSTWQYFFVSLLDVDETNQNCVYGGASFTPNPTGFHKIMELKMIIASDATPQTIIIDTTTTPMWGEYTINSNRITNVIPGSIQIKGKLASDTLVFKDVMIHPGTRVAMPLYMRTSVPVSSWIMPITYGDGSTPIVLDSVSYQGAWPAFARATYYDDGIQSCALTGVAVPPHEPGYHLVGTLHFFCKSTAPQQTIVVDTTSHEFGTRDPMSYTIVSNGTNYVTSVRPGYLYVIVGSEEQPGGGVVCHGIYPTIVRNGSDMRIRYSCGGLSPMSVKMYDVTGRKVAQIYQGIPVQNLLDIAYRPQDLAGGVYFVYVEYDGVVDVKKVVVTR